MEAAIGPWQNNPKWYMVQERMRSQIVRARIFGIRIRHVGEYLAEKETFLIMLQVCQGVLRRVFEEPLTFVAIAGLL